MASAAERAARTLGASERNRPSRQMSSSSGLASSGLRSSFNTGADSSGEGSGSGAGDPAAARGGGGPGNGGPLFMDDLRGQYESLSEKLARESAAAERAAPSDGGGKGGGGSRKVRWARTAAIASGMDAEKALADEDDPDHVRRSPMDVLADLFRKKYTLPAFLL
eukprot:CAMPEP_0172561296 /NCGR_PEP_ID=MMETSP1067-20121228/92323_1 /TAXON_ID=265564 ORGANISM="Thalassiosira punctigera, Strain Tpunct2005C2" /NCGR_SAMPLE_ID=MMETSP1067 /ASSEMBLY_ACC=CAM_ASM_000444 /LENGTH=164 /DNA_ID=CAMNT_0013351313 /DNA_START=125 /DNA_END=616 /DNA_ORIENTATION=-